MTRRASSGSALAGGGVARSIAVARLGGRRCKLFFSLRDLERRARRRLSSCSSALVMGPGDQRHALHRHGRGLVSGRLGLPQRRVSIGGGELVALVTSSCLRDCWRSPSITSIFDARMQARTALLAASLQSGQRRALQSRARTLPRPHSRSPPTGSGSIDSATDATTMLVNSVAADSGPRNATNTWASRCSSSAGAPSTPDGAAALSRRGSNATRGRSRTGISQRADRRGAPGTSSVNSGIAPCTTRQGRVRSATGGSGATSPSAMRRRTPLAPAEHDRRACSQTQVRGTGRVAGGHSRRFAPAFHWTGRHLRALDDIRASGCRRRHACAGPRMASEQMRSPTLRPMASMADERDKCGRTLPPGCAARSRALSCACRRASCSARSSSISAPCRSTTAS